MDTSSDNPFSIAQSIMNHRDVDNVRASKTKIRVAHVADERNARAIPERLVEFLTDTFSDTKFVWEAEEPSPSAVEVHSVSGGRGQDPICGAIGRDQTELQVRFVERRR